jgi:chromosomal replication initiation ATPase DnaA
MRYKREFQQARQYFINKNKIRKMTPMYNNLFLSGWNAAVKLLDISAKQKNEKLFNILLLVAKPLGCSIAGLISKSRERELADARKIYCMLAEEQGGYSLAEIGDTIGGRDHSTVSVAIKEGRNLLDKDEKFRVKMERVLEYERAKDL